MLRLLPAALLLGLLCAPLALAAGPDDHKFEVMIDAGAAMPLGDLGAGFPQTISGLGAEPGYRVGLRVNAELRDGWILTPTFTFTEFGDFDGLDDQTGKTGGFGQKFKVRASSLRYGLDVGYLAPGPADAWRGFAAVGVAAVLQRYQEEMVDDETTYEASVWDLSWMVSVGLRHGSLELALEYHRSSFATTRFVALATDADYTWNYAALRLGYALPRF
jgi:hypothetical protein